MINIYIKRVDKTYMNVKSLAAYVKEKC